MVRREYACAACGTHLDVAAPISHDPPAALPCPRCGEPLARRYSAPAVLVKGGRRRETPLRRRFVGRERDGSETVYTTLEQAARGERERADGAGASGVPFAADVQRRLATENVRHLRKTEGLLPGTDAARFCEAIESCG